MSLAEQIGSIVDQMPQRNQALVLELVKTMISPDDILTDEDIADIEQARADFERGEFYMDADIEWK